MRTPVLIVESEMPVAMDLANTLEKFDCDIIATVTNAKEAYAQAIAHRPHIILMDVNLNGKNDGISVAENILQDIHTTVIYLTACSDTSSIDRAISTKPSAYLIKPFERQKLLAAVKIALIQYKQNTKSLHVRENAVILNDKFSYDKTQRQLYCHNTPVHLTSREGELMHLLIHANNTVISTYRLENILWPDKPPVESTRRALISRLRAKLNHQLIETLPGVGYRLKYKLQRCCNASLL